MRRILILFAIMLLSGVAVVCVAWQQFYGDAVKANAVIHLGSSELSDGRASDLIDSLVKPHIKNHFAFNLYSERLNLDSRLKPGRYELKEGQSVIDIVRMLKLGEQSPVMVTFNNIRTVEALAGRLAEQIEADSVSLVERLRLEPNAMAIFIPNTYEMWWTVTPDKLVERMNREYDRFWTDRREEARIRLGLSRLEVSTLASIVYEESAKVDEMGRIAGVYINRLHIGMKLQADPTVKYAVGEFTLQRILYKHLEYDSPYNTYKYAGLPPSPIAMPSIAALDGVLNYEHHNYLYFCARPEMDGYHNFASSYSKHLANARAYSAELDRRGIK